MFKTYCCWLIASGLVKCSTAVLTKLRNCSTPYLSLRSVLPNCTSVEGQKQGNIFLFQCRIEHFTWRHGTLLLATQIFLTSIVTQHSVCFNSWQWRVAQQNTRHCCVSTATVVTRTRHSVTRRLHCLSCYITVRHFLDRNRFSWQGICNFSPFPPCGWWLVLITSTSTRQQFFQSPVLRQLVPLKRLNLQHCTVSKQNTTVWRLFSLWRRSTYTILTVSIA